MMFSINFSDLKSEIPDLKEAWELLEEWLHAHQSIGVISQAAIVQFMKRRRPLKWSDVARLSFALDSLAEKGVLERRFAVQQPSGQLLYPYYSTRDEIPSRMQDEFDEWVSTEDAEIKPVFVGPRADD